MVWPVMKSLSGDAKNKHKPTTSFGIPSLFMERLPIIAAILAPCFAILVFVFIMWHESYWTLIVRKIYFAIVGS